MQFKTNILLFCSENIKKHFSTTYWNLIQFAVETYSVCLEIIWIEVLFSECKEQVLLRFIFIFIYLCLNLQLLFYTWRNLTSSI